MGCYIWYGKEGTGRAGAPPSPLLAVPNVTAHPSTASVPITVLLYNGPLVCGFNVATKGLNYDTQHSRCRLTGIPRTVFSTVSTRLAVMPIRWWYSVCSTQNKLSVQWLIQRGPIRPCLPFDDPGGGAISSCLPLVWPYRLYMHAHRLQHISYFLCIAF